MILVKKKKFRGSYIIFKLNNFNYFFFSKWWLVKMVDLIDV